MKDSIAAVREFGMEKFVAAEHRERRSAMMKRLIVVCEGPTEKEFCRDLLIPHLQLHEFESLLFSDVDVFAQNFEAGEMDLEKLRKVRNEFSNPEAINNSPKTAPSVRIAEAVKSYRKVLYGNCLAMNIGLNKMRQCCPHFNEWVKELERINM